MNVGLLRHLLCPNCTSDDLHLTPFVAQNDDVIEGIIRCAACDVWYCIENGIADLMCAFLRNQTAHHEERSSMNYPRGIGVMQSSHHQFAEKHHLQLPAGDTPLDESNKQTQKEFYEDEENAEEYESLVVNSNYYRALNEVTFIPWMREHLDSGRMALDLGCGTGKQCVYLAQHGVQTVGIDISLRTLGIARTKIAALGLNRIVDFVVADAENPPVKDGCFDACVFSGTLHHMEHKDVAIHNAARKLRETGVFYSLDPHKSPVRFLFDLLMRLWKIYDEKASDDPLLTEEIMQQWLQEAGFVDKIRLSTYFPPHLWLLFGEAFGVSFLRLSDKILSGIPGLRKCAGVIMAQGIKTTSA